MPNISKLALERMLHDQYHTGLELGKKMGYEQARREIAAADETKRIQAVTNLLQEGGKMMSKAGWLLRSHTKQPGR